MNLRDRSRGRGRWHRHGPRDRNLFAPKARVWPCSADAKRCRGHGGGHHARRRHRVARGGASRREIDIARSWRPPSAAHGGIESWSTRRRARARRLHDVTVADFEASLRTNLLGASSSPTPWWRHARPRRRQHHHIGSALGTVAVPLSRPTSPPRGAAHAREGGRRRASRDSISVNVVAPGTLDTDIGRASPGFASADRAPHPIRRAGTSTKSPGVPLSARTPRDTFTGSVARVDGGWTAS